MILYHTSDREIRNPDIHYGRKNADFGWGFYLTPDRVLASGGNRQKKFIENRQNWIIEKDQTTQFWLIS